MTTPSSQPNQDLGFGSNVAAAQARLINKDGSFNVRREGESWFSTIGAYQYLITLPWWQFLLVVVVSYLVLNSLFAGIYVLAGVEGLTQAPRAGAGAWADGWHNFSHAFFFSAQTFTTVGYGGISPQPGRSLINVIAAFEAMGGLLGFALATGILYGRFSQPTAKIRFSENALIAPYQQINSFQFRMVNRRRSQLIEISVKVTLMRYEWVDGQRKQRFYALPLERDQVTLFPLTWTIVHPVASDSPLYGVSQEDLVRSHAEFLVIVQGYDDTFAQEVHARTSYRAEELVWGARFVPAFYPDTEGTMVVHIDKVGQCEATGLNPEG